MTGDAPRSRNRPAMLAQYPRAARPRVLTRCDPTSARRGWRHGRALLRQGLVQAIVIEQGPKARLAVRGDMRGLQDDHIGTRPVGSDRIDQRGTGAAVPPHHDLAGLLDGVFPGPGDLVVRPVFADQSEVDVAIGVGPAIAEAAAQKQAANGGTVAERGADDLDGAV
ncbi:hypothetical protein GLS40_03520 [Pseudooceanicola sp. 216_PA32_1]|uniref:Uncharacterized protein n=1 Tax=Pseudooceanicola pacificus TaxID=2676438 RepID=A0A844VZ84_9RHOB|nr:hypothetical protein [Pseudooceanicola pacificus]